MDDNTLMLLILTGSSFIIIFCLAFLDSLHRVEDLENEVIRLKKKEDDKFVR